ncbi:hypothetical protein GCM10027162_01770 [Streptomyces incanus]
MESQGPAAVTAPAASIVPAVAATTVNRQVLDQVPGQATDRVIRGPAAVATFTGRLGRNRASRGRTAAATRARRGRTAPANRATCGLAARQGLSSGTTTSPFRDHTPA